MSATMSHPPVLGCLSVRHPVVSVQYNRCGLSHGDKRGPGVVSCPQVQKCVTTMQEVSADGGQPIFPVFCLLSSNSCLLSAVCCPLSDVCCLLSDVCCLLSAVCCLLSAVCCLLSAVRCPLFDVCCPLSAVYCLLSDV